MPFVLLKNKSILYNFVREVIRKENDGYIKDYTNENPINFMKILIRIDKCM